MHEAVEARLGGIADELHTMMLYQTHMGSLQNLNQHTSIPVAEVS